MTDIPKFTDFLADSRMSLVASWFSGVPGIHVEVVARRWVDLNTCVSGVGAVSLVCHIYGVDSQTALDLIRLSEETGGRVVPNNVGTNARALQLEFPDEETR